MRAVLLHSSIGSIEEAAESYVLNRLPVAERETYEKHLLVCRRCQDAVATVDEFIEVFREALSHPSPVPVRLARKVVTMQASC